MLMPDKHIKFSESLLGLGAYVLENLQNPKTIDELWGDFCKARKGNQYPANHSFENLVLSVDSLYAIGAIKAVETQGVLLLCV